MISEFVSSTSSFIKKVKLKKMVATTKKMVLCLQNMYDFMQHVTHLFPFKSTDDLSQKENDTLKDLCIMIINVKRSTERLELIKKQIEPLGLNTFVFHAVDASDIKVYDTELQGVKIAEYNRNYFLIDQTRRFDYVYRGDLPTGMIGCTLSHILLYNMIQFERTFKHYLILEDDAIVHLSPTQTRKYLANLPDDYEMVYLNSEAKWYPIAKTTPINDYYSNIQRRHFNASVSYLVNKLGAARLLAYSRHDVTRPPDDLLSNLNSLGGYTVITTNEFLFGNNYELESDCERFSKESLTTSTTKGSEGPKGTDS